jgi:hypothetical protein
MTGRPKDGVASLACVPAIRVFAIPLNKDVDGRDKHGQNDA